MKQDNVSAQLMQLASEQSDHDTNRHYLSLARAYEPAHRIVQYARMGNVLSTTALLSYRAKMVREDIKSRLRKIYGSNYELRDIVYKEHIKGHPPCWVSGSPVIIKSIKDDYMFPKNGIIPDRVYSHIQAYMAYSTAQYGLIIYESRSSGLTKHYWVQRDPKAVSIIRDKYEQALKEFLS